MSHRKAKTKRQRLLARIHILEKECWPGDPERAHAMRRELMGFNFGVSSAAKLADADLEALVELLEGRRKAPGARRTGRSLGGRLEHLRSQARATARELDWEDKRFRGLCRKKCGVDRVEWCNDIKKLTALVKTLEGYLRQEFERATQQKSPGEPGL